MTRAYLGAGLLADTGEGQRVLGTYTPGHTPRILVHDQDSWLTGLHEQTHRDDIQNTLYGLVVSCENELGQGSSGGILRRWKARSMTARLLRRAWGVLEGSAVASEYLALLHQREFALLESRLYQLPPAYGRAFAPYMDLLVEGLLRPMQRAAVDPLVYCLVSAYRMAISELALDLVFHKAQVHPTSYSDLRSTVGRAKPAKAFDAIAEALPEIDHQAIGHRIQDLAREGEAVVFAGRQEVVSVRLQVLAIKEAILSHMGLGPDLRVLSDPGRQSIKESARRQFENRFHGLKPWRFAREYLGARSLTDLAAQAPRLGQIHEVAVGATDFLERLQLPLSDAKVMGRVVHAVPSASAESVNVFAFEFEHATGSDHVCRIRTVAHHAELHRDELAQGEASQADETFAWSGLYRVDAGGEPLDLHLWQDLAAPVYLYSRVFDASVLQRLGSDLIDPVFTVAPAPGPLPLSIVMVQAGSLHVYWIESTLNLKAARADGAIDIGQDVRLRYLPMIDKPMFGAAYVLALHTLASTPLSV